MRIGACDTCAAKDSEIAHLREQVSQLQTKLISIVDPALEARLAHAKRMAEQPAREPNQTRPNRNSVSFLRRTKSVGLEVVPDRRSAADVEAGFRAKGPA